MKKSEVLDIIHSLPEDISPGYLASLFARLEQEEPPRRFTESQKRMLARAEKDVEDGRIVDSEEVRRLEGEWREGR